jgi:hypothetical protein
MRFLIISHPVSLSPSEGEREEILERGESPLLLYSPFPYKGRGQGGWIGK